MQAKAATLDQRTATFVLAAVILMAAWLAIVPSVSAAPSCQAEFLQIARTQHGLTPKDVHDILASNGLDVANPGQTIRLVREGGVEVFDNNRGDYFGCLDLDAK